MDEIKYAWARVPEAKLSGSHAYDFAMTHWIQKTVESGPNGLRNVVFVYCLVRQGLDGPEFIPVPIWEIPEAHI